MSRAGARWDAIHDRDTRKDENESERQAGGQRFARKTDAQRDTESGAKTAAAGGGQRAERFEETEINQHPERGRAETMENGTIASAAIAIAHPAVTTGVVSLNLSRYRASSVHSPEPDSVSGSGPIPASRDTRGAVSTSMNLITTDLIDDPALPHLAVWERARVNRDPAFDGVFYSGVRTTRIYCRPVCPVRPAKAENIRFFPTAASAERAGYRPCLRCRPETAPGSPAWLGSATTVARAMRLIGEGYLDEHSVEDLSDKLGIGGRQLSRLFLRHAQASPSQVAATRRVQHAKRMIDETDLSITEIAFASGFKSVRRFNDAFRLTYKRTPSSLRKS